MSVPMTIIPNLHDRRNAALVAVDLTKLALLIEISHLGQESGTGESDLAASEAQLLLDSLPEYATFIRQVSMFDADQNRLQIRQATTGDNSALSPLYEFIRSGGGSSHLAVRAAASLTEAHSRAIDADDSGASARRASDDPGFACGVYVGLAVVAGLASAGLLAGVAVLAAVNSCL